MSLKAMPIDCNPAFVCITHKYEKWKLGTFTIPSNNTFIIVYCKKKVVPNSCYNIFQLHENLLKEVIRSCIIGKILDANIDLNVNVINIYAE